MKASDFSKQGYPGILIGTEVRVRRERNGVPEVIPFTGEAFVPNPLPPSLDWPRVLGELVGPLTDAVGALARLDEAASRLPNPHLLLRPLLMREAQQSSEIENTVATLEEVALDAAGVKFDRSEPILVGNYVRALEHGLRSDYPIGLQLMNEMHAVLLRGTGNQSALPGQIRREQNLIGREGDVPQTARFVPPPAGPYLDECLREFSRFVQSPTPHLPALIAIALAHYQFESIHPYRDGNGRLGRLLITLTLCRYRLLAIPAVYVSGYFEEHRKAYYDKLLAVSQHGAWSEWLEFFLNAVLVQSRDARGRVDALVQLREAYQRRITSPRTSVLAHRLIDHLFARQVATVKLVEQWLGVSTSAARKHVAAFVKLGILENSGATQHPQRYVARGILRMAEGKEVAL